MQNNGQICAPNEHNFPLQFKGPNGQILKSSGSVDQLFKLYDIHWTTRDQKDQSAHDQNLEMSLPFGTFGAFVTHQGKKQKQNHKSDQVAYDYKGQNKIESWIIDNCTVRIDERLRIDVTSWSERQSGSIRIPVAWVVDVGWSLLRTKLMDGEHCCWNTQTNG